MHLLALFLCFAALSPGSAGQWKVHRVRGRKCDLEKLELVVIRWEVIARGSWSGGSAIGAARTAEADRNYFVSLVEHIFQRLTPLTYYNPIACFGGKPCTRAGNRRCCVETNALHSKFKSVRVSENRWKFTEYLNLCISDSNLYSASIALHAAQRDGHVTLSCCWELR